MVSGECDRKVKGHGLMVVDRSVGLQCAPCECSPVAMISLFGVASGDLALSVSVSCATRQSRRSRNETRGHIAVVYIYLDIDLRTVSLPVYLTTRTIFTSPDHETSEQAPVSPRSLTVSE